MTLLGCFCWSKDLGISRVNNNNIGIFNIINGQFRHLYRPLFVVQGFVELPIPRLNSNSPVILCEVRSRWFKLFWISSMSKIPTFLSSSINIIVQTSVQVRIKLPHHHHRMTSISHGVYLMGTIPVLFEEKNLVIISWSDWRLSTNSDRYFPV